MTNLINRFWRRRVRPIWRDPVWAAVIATSIGGPAIYGYVSGSAARLLAWLGDTVTIYRWQLPAAFAGGMLLVIATVSGWWLRRRQPGGYTRIKVRDGRLPIEWLLLQDPKKWIDDTSISEQTPRAHADILAGPYHTAWMCGSEIESEYTGHGSSDDDGPRLKPVCQSCGGVIFDTHPERADPQLFKVRLQAIQELQRMHRQRIPIKDGAELTQPKYRQFMLRHEPEERDPEEIRD